MAGALLNAVPPLAPRPCKTGLQPTRAALLCLGSVAAVASEQFLQVFADGRLDQMRIETRVEARVADIRTHVASESNQIELLRGKPLPQTTCEVNPAHPR